MGILRRKKLKKHINKISYCAIFMIATIIISVAVVSGKDRVEYMEFAESETYIVDVVSKERANLEAASIVEEVTEAVTEAPTEIVTEAATEEVTTKNDESSYKGIFIMNTSGNLNIRQKAGTESEVVGILTEGNGGDVIKYGKEWTKIKSGKVTGYVSTQFILIGDKAKEALKENGYIAKVTTDTLKVRSERSLDGTVLGMAANGSEYKCTKVYPKWAKIKFEGQTGYVSREYVKLETVMTYAKTVEEIEAEQVAISSEQSTENTQSNATQNTSSKKSSQSNSTVSNNTGSSTQNRKPVANVSYDDKYLLACLVACEAGGESYEAKLAVANVVLNRVASSVYPSSISGVIYQSGQFGPASNSSLERMLKNGPDSGSQKAANAALAGTNNVPGYLFFGRTESINVKNLKSYRIIDSQVFY